VDMTRLVHMFDGPSDILNVRPIMGELVLGKIGQGRDMSVPKHHCHVAGSYGVAFKKSLAYAAAVEGLAGQIGTERTSGTLLARFPVVRPGAFHLLLLALGACSPICSTPALTGGPSNARPVRVQRLVRRHDPSPSQRARRWCMATAPLRSGF